MTGHEFEAQESGRFVRMTCTCGWVGDWRPASMRSLTRALHSDENVHYYATKRAEEAAR